jgi:hypothetical protein
VPGEHHLDDEDAGEDPAASIATTVTSGASALRRACRIVTHHLGSPLALWFKMPGGYSVGPGPNGGALRESQTTASRPVPDRSRAAGGLTG